MGLWVCVTNAKNKTMSNQKDDQKPEISEQDAKMAVHVASVRAAATARREGGDLAALNACLNAANDLEMTDDAGQTWIFYAPTMAQTHAVTLLAQSGQLERFQEGVMHLCTTCYISAFSERVIEHLTGKKNTKALLRKIQKAFLYSDRFTPAQLMEVKRWWEGRYDDLMGQADGDGEDDVAGDEEELESEPESEVEPGKPESNNSSTTEEGVAAPGMGG